MRIKRFAAGIAAAVLFLPVCCSWAEETEEAAVQDVSEADIETEESEDDEEYILRSEEEVLKTMKKACENEFLRLLYSEEEDLIALENRKNGYIWWSSPINAEADESTKGTIKKELASSLIIVYGQPDDRTTSTMRSARNGRMQYKVYGDTLEVTYRFPSAGFKIPVKYTLNDDSLSAKIDTSEIEETKKDGEDSMILLEISVLPNITDASDTEEGYYIVPDGSGAVINFNNGKTNSHVYSSMVYGDDVTAVPLTSPAVTEQVYLPLYASVLENGNGMLSVIHKGDANARLQASVSGLSKSHYNTCCSKFVVRSTDTYYMNGEPLTVFEKGDICTPELEMKFFPMYKKGLDFTDAAEVYRDYLIAENGVKKKESDISLCINLYGGVLKKEPVLGVPVTRKKAVTTFDQAQTIVSELIESGAKNIKVTLDNWTDDGISGKTDSSSKPSSVLGSAKEYKNMKKYFSDNEVLFYPVSENITFRSGNGFWEFTDTALRTSGQYARRIFYSPAYGTQDGTRKPVSLLSPALFGEIFGKLSKGELDGICTGDMTSVLYGSYGKEKNTRNDAMESIMEGLSLCCNEGVSIFSNKANAYVLGYTDHVSGIPVSSGKFDIFDGDIPFYQVVLHGIMPYSTTAVNGDTDPENLILMAAASGSGLEFDLVYEDVSKLKDTEYDKLFYAGYSYWTDTAAAGSRFVRDVLSGLEDDYITGYSQEGGHITTVYSDGTKIITDLVKKSILRDGKEFLLEEYISG